MPTISIYLPDNLYQKVVGMDGDNVSGNIKKVLEKHFEEEEQ